MNRRRFAHRASLVVVFLLFAAVGALKLFGASVMVEKMNVIGFRAGIRLSSGLVELSGALGLLTRFRNIALLLLLPFPIAGLGIHLSYGHPWYESLSAILMLVLIPMSLWLDERFQVKV